MKDAHKGRGITEKEFDIIKGHVVAAMQELNVSADLIQEVGELLETVRKDCTSWEDEVDKFILLKNYFNSLLCLVAHFLEVLKLFS